MPVASPAETSAGKGPGIPRMSGTCSVSYPSPAARRTLVCHALRVPVVAMLTPKRKGRELMMSPGRARVSDGDDRRRTGRGEPELADGRPSETVDVPGAFPS